MWFASVILLHYYAHILYVEHKSAVDQLNKIVCSIEWQPYNYQHSKLQTKFQVKQFHRPYVVSEKKKFKTRFGFESTLPITLLLSYDGSKSVQKLESILKLIIWM